MKWGFAARLVKDLLEAKNAVRSVLAHPRVAEVRALNDEAQRLQNKLYADNSFWNKMNDIKGLLCPLNEMNEKTQSRSSLESLI
jgi:hypothetical protein